MFQNREQQQQNIYVYHSVFAQALSAIFQAIVDKNEKEARRLIELNIIYAKSLLDKKIDVEELKRKSLEELLEIMVKEHRDAKLIPVQVFDYNSFYNKLKKYRGGEA